MWAVKPAYSFFLPLLKRVGLQTYQESFMKRLTIVALLSCVLIAPSVAVYTPPDNGGPGTSQGTGTRVVRFGLF